MSSNNSSNNVARLALISLIPIFIFVVGNGWASILGPYVRWGGAPFLENVVSYMAGILFAVVSVILAWAVAAERVRLRQETTSKYSWVAYLGVLFVLSALGTMNWMFKVSAAPTFIKESAIATETSLAALEKLAQNGIILVQTPKLLLEQAEQKNKLNGLVTQLKSALDAERNKTVVDRRKARDDIMTLVDAFEAEVTNELRAGCGEVAQSYIDQIKAKLPDLLLPSGSCRDAKPDVVVKTYKDAIQKAMDRLYSDPGSICVISPQVRTIAAKIEAIIKVPIMALGSSCPSREAVISDTEAAVKKYIAAFPNYSQDERELVDLRERSSQRLSAQIAKVNAIYLNAEGAPKSVAAPVLKEAWSEYRLVYNDLGQAVEVEKISTLPKSIDDPRIDKIGDISNTIEILVSRYDHLSTYPIVLAGILFDMILIAFFFRVVSSNSGKNGLTPHEIRMHKIRSSLSDTAREKS
jgi:hypothetical protein